MKFLTFLTKSGRYFIIRSLNSFAQLWKLCSIIGITMPYFVVSRRICCCHRKQLSQRTELDKLENYVLAFGIQGYRWTDGKPWTYKFRANLEQADDGVQEQTAELQSLKYEQSVGCRTASCFFETFAASKFG